MHDVKNWPRVIQLAWIVADYHGQTIAQNEILIKPESWTIPGDPNNPKDRFWIDHGFSTAKSLAEGRELRPVLLEFLADLEKCDYLVSHNMAFDMNIVGAELIRYEMKGKKCKKICTMESTVNLCKIPFSGQRAYLTKSEKMYKWPQLKELYAFLFGREMDGGHQAGQDTTALKDVFFELVKRGVFVLEPGN